MFSEFSKLNSGGNENSWYELYSLYNEMIQVSEQFLKMPRKVNRYSPVATNVANMHAAFKEVKLEDSYSPAKAIDSKKSKKTRTICQVPPMQDGDGNIGNDDCLDGNDAELWNEATMKEVETLIEKMLAIQPPNENPAQMQEFLSRSGEVAEQLNRKNAKVRKAYFPFYFVFRLLPKLLRFEFMRTRRGGHPPNVVELQRYLKSYLKSIPGGIESISKAEKTRNSPRKNPSKYCEFKSSRISGNLDVGNVAEIIDELLETPPLSFDPDELSLFLCTLDDVSNRLRKVDIQMKKLKMILPFYLSFRLIPSSLKNKFVNHREATRVPVFDELHRFLVAYSHSPRSTTFPSVDRPSSSNSDAIRRSRLGWVPVTGLTDTSSTSRNICTEPTPSKCSTIFMPPPSSPTQDENEPPLIAPAEPSGNPVVYGIYATNSQVDLYLCKSGKQPVSLLYEFCARRKYRQPEFHTVKEDGPPHQKRFIMKVTVNDVDYQSSVTSKKKNIAKSEAAKVCLRSLGVTEFLR
uniref:DRBM domain-containing protein n=2 Tax=Lygus hesperus TaxID=30085 RepID=A0A0K8T283_LYGHE